MPVKYFETVGKTARDSRDSANSGASAPHDSGYAADSTQPVAVPKTAISGPTLLGHRNSKSLSKLGGGSGAMVYGIVAYDFHAERPDELEAKEGEAIIVIAQSNPEWFVAKPITRLGGPGLIPVSFIEIKDMHTGQPVTDTAGAIARAGIPRVEEWKKMAADYKNTSIPLGQFGNPAHASQGPMSPLQQGMDRMSLGASTNGFGHSRSTSNNNFSQQQAPASTLPYPVRATVPRFVYVDDKFHFVVECALSDGSQWDLSRIYEDFYELQINLIKAFPEEAGQTGHPRTLPFMPGPVQFVTDKISEGRRENLHEYLHNLLRLGQHIVKSQLVGGFFAARGGDYEVDPNAPPSSGQQLAPSPSVGTNPRHSQSSQHSLPHPTQPATYQTTQHQRQLSSQTAAQRGPAHYRNVSDFSQASGTMPNATNPTASTTAPPIQRQTTQQSQSSASTMATTAAPSTAPLRVKVWFDRDTCVVVRMPAKGQFRYADLYRKIEERRKLEFKDKKDSGLEDEAGSDGNGNGKGIGEGGVDGGGADKQPRLEIEYRDERDGEYYRLADDEELSQAVETCEKLTLVVRELGT